MRRTDLAVHVPVMPTIHANDHCHAAPRQACAADHDQKHPGWRSDEKLCSQQRQEHEADETKAEDNEAEDQNADG